MVIMAIWWLMIVHNANMWGVPGGTPMAGWFIVENPQNLFMKFRGTPMTQETPISGHWTWTNIWDLFHQETLRGVKPTNKLWVFRPQEWVALKPQRSWVKRIVPGNGAWSSGQAVKFRFCWTGWSQSQRGVMVGNHHQSSSIIINHHQSSSI